MPIEKLQRLLNKAGFGPLSVDGKMGPKTTKALNAAKKAMGEPQNGMAGPKITAALKAGEFDGGEYTGEGSGDDGDDDEGGGGANETGKRTKKQKAAEEKGDKGVGGKEDDTVSIWRSKSLQWSFDRDTGKWFASYKLPNSSRRIFFEATGSQLDAIFGKNQRPLDFQHQSFADITADQTFAGDISEAEGTGSFEANVDRVTELALDEGVLPDWAKGDDKVMDLVYIAHTEQKSQEWLIEQISKLKSFRKRFPGLEILAEQGLSLTEQIAGFLQMESSMMELQVKIGKDPASIDPDLVAKMLAKGHSISDIRKTYDIFDRFEKNVGALTAFNEILAASGQNPMDADDMFEFLAGNASAEIYELYEQSSFKEAADVAGLDLSVQTAIELAAATTGRTSFDQAFEGLNIAAKSLLTFRTEIALDKYNINVDDLIDLSLGISPRSGTSQAEIGRNVERALAAARAGVTGPRATSFRSFSAEGIPQAVSSGRKSQQRG